MMTSRMKRGRGMAASWYGIARTATIDRAGAWAELDDGGTGKVVTGVTEIGEGILTVLAQVAAEEMHARGKRGGLLKAFLHAKARFIKILFLKRGFMDGRAGWVLAFNAFFYTFQKYIRLTELNAGKKK